jgi:hypothetical protein
MGHTVLPRLRGVKAHVTYGVLVCSATYSALITLATFHLIELRVFHTEVEGAVSSGPFPYSRLGFGLTFAAFTRGFARIAVQRYHKSRF